MQNQDKYNTEIVKTVLEKDGLILLEKYINAKTKMLCIDGEGYYIIDASVSVAPTAAGMITVAVYSDGVQIPGAIAYTTGTAGDPVAVSINATIRQGCCCNNDDKPKYSRAV